MRSAALLVLCVSCLYLVGCAGLGPSPMLGTFYADYNYPGYYSDANADGPGSKRGEATSRSWLGVCSLGDCSIEAACKAGSITTVHTIDHQFKNILGVYSEWTTIVTGE